MSIRYRILRTWAPSVIVAALCAALAPIPATAQDDCVGDCNDSGTVTVDEMVVGVNIALDRQPVSVCPSFDCDNTGSVPVNCLIQAVNNLLDGCGGGDCPLTAGTYTITQVSGGTLRVGSLSPFPFPAGGTITLDAGAATQPACQHNVVVPATGGFTSPPFCIPALGFTATITQTGCGIGRVASNGGADFTITEVGDTSSEPECNNQQACMDGVDSRLRLDVTVGDGTPDECTSGSANAVFSIPVRTLSWLDGSQPPACPAADGMYNPEVDTLILDVGQILDFTTDSTAGSWMDLSGDGCAIAGTGPTSGLMNAGSCWDIGGQSVTIAASGPIASERGPLFDFSFETALPNSISGPGPSQGATCPSPPALEIGGTAIRCLE